MKMKKYYLSNPLIYISKENSLFNDLCELVRDSKDFKECKNNTKIAV